MALFWEVKLLCDIFNWICCRGRYEKFNDKLFFPLFCDNWIFVIATGLKLLSHRGLVNYHRPKSSFSTEYFTVEFVKNLVNVFNDVEKSPTVYFFYQKLFIKLTKAGKIIKFKEVHRFKLWVFLLFFWVPTWPKFKPALMVTVTSKVVHITQRLTFSKQQIA
jgi:hypothetical protein